MTNAVRAPVLAAPAQHTQALRVLALLRVHAGQIVRAEDLVAAMYAGTTGPDSEDPAHVRQVLSVAISRARRQLRPGGRIRSVYGVGYRLYGEAA